MKKIIGDGQTNCDGLKFIMIDSIVEKEFPELANIFQKALNIEHHIGEGSINVDVPHEHIRFRNTTMKIRSA